MSDMPLSEQGVIADNQLQCVVLNSFHSIGQESYCISIAVSHDNVPPMALCTPTKEKEPTSRLTKEKVPTFQLMKPAALACL